MQDYDSTAQESAVTTEESDAIIVAGDDGEILEDDSEDDDVDERPQDCDCRDWHGGAELPCFACHRAGFETVAE